MTQVARARRNRVGWFVGASAVVAALVAGGGAVLAIDTHSDAAIQASIDSVLTGGCVSASEARPALEAQLNADGFTHWTVESRAGGTACVTAGPIEPEEVVVLLPVLGGDLSAVMAKVREELMERCLDEAQTRSFVTQALHGAGLADFEITTDGPVGYPRGQRDAVSEHMDAGCFVYSGSGHTADGVPLFGISGGEADS
jgi:hypothetical protein